jgi:hypothetical protein
MDYKTFINTIEQHQTEKIKSMNRPESSSPWPIPENFQVLLPDVTKIIEYNFDDLSDAKSYIAIFGFQTTGVAIESDFPIINNRIFLPDHMRSHLSCVLYYLPVDDINQPQDWAYYKSVVIDFTSGIVMNANYYLYMMGARTTGGKVLGKINAHKLKEVWHSYRS